jgi:hypothetical protein
MRAQPYRGVLPRFAHQLLSLGNEFISDVIETSD